MTEVFMDQENKNEQHRSVIVIKEAVPDARKTKNLAIYSLVLGILSIVFCIVPYISIFLGIIGLIQGIISLAQHRPGQGMAVGGVVTGCIGTIFSVISAFVWIVGLAYM